MKKQSGKENTEMSCLKKGLLDIMYVIPDFDDANKKEDWRLTCVRRKSQEYIDPIVRGGCGGYAEMKLLAQNRNAFIAQSTRINVIKDLSPLTLEFSNKCSS